LIKNIQALRAVAALLVVFVHVEVLLHTLGLAPFGYGGVDVFFVISGLVMVRTTHGRDTTPFAFAKNRIARIVPIYWLMTLAVFAVAMAAPSLLQSTTADPVLLLKSLFFIPFEKPNGLVQPVLFVGWTLNYEMFFYALFALGLAFPRYLVGLAVTAVAIVGLVIAGAVLEPQGTLARFYTSPLMLEFVLGMGLGLIVDRIPVVRAKLAKVAALMLLVACLGAVVIAPLLLPSWPNLVTVGFPATLLVLAALALERWGWRIENPLWMALGDASYVLYLCHPFVTQAVQKFAMKLEPQGVVSVGLIGLTLILVCLLALAVHRWVEKPISDVARRLLLARSLKAQPAA
jgi:exopolysaccharide production protein ExoZ